MAEAKLAALRAVYRADGNLPDAGAAGRENPEQIVRIAERRPEPVEVDGPKCGAGDGRIPTLAIADALADRERGEAAENLTTDPSREAHRGACGAIAAAIALHIVGAARDDREDDAAQIFGVHRPVAGHDRDDILRMIAVRSHERGSIPGGDGGADASTVRMTDDLDARITRRASFVGRSIGAAVVDDDDAVDERRHGPDDASDETLLLEGRDDHDDATAFDHAWPSPP